MNGLLPRKPQLTTWGAYDPSDLSRYLDEANEAGMSNHVIARHLGVSIDRIVYMTGVEGRRILDRRLHMLAECRL